MQAYERQHYDTVRALTPDCLVLLKSDGSFPLAGPEPIALYGSGARHTIKGGTGSGDVNVRHYPTIEEGLETAGCPVTTKAWLDRYDAARATARQTFIAEKQKIVAAQGFGVLASLMGAEPDEPAYDLPLDGAGETAVYVLARRSGEGTDRTDKPGDLHLTDTEIRDILALQQTYKRFLLVLNVGGVVDLSPVVDQVANILLLSQPGIAVGDAFADVLLGKAAPSGRLSATWAAAADYAGPGDFGGQDDTRYREGIYVGYRYFDAAGKSPLFPFGYGLSYTTFGMQPGAVAVNSARVNLPVTVTNTGARPGKQVAQLYLRKPAGKLDEPARELAAYQKTRTLAPGESETLTLSFALPEMAAYDAASGAWVLEAGVYRLYLGENCRDAALCGALALDATVTVQQAPAVGGTPDFADWVPAAAPEDPLPAGIATVPLDLAALAVAPHAPAEPDPETLATVHSMTDEELATLCVGTFAGAGSESVVGNAGVTVAGAAGETRAFPRYGIPGLVMADGPAGLRLASRYVQTPNGPAAVGADSFADMFEMIPEAMRTAIQATMGGGAKTPEGPVYEQPCTAIPIGTALAQSWDPAVVEACGDLVGDEMERLGVHLWLAPALNLHRSPLCGRNFEYYSEDPLLSGRTAAAMTRGVQKHPGCGVTLKHFCCNNQETNRMHSNSQVSPRALRELYLKGFAIAVREAAPAAIMTSYNLLNGEHTSQRADLMEELLRKEWGYRGLVMTDWVIPSFSPDGQRYPGACASGTIGAGNDLMMPGSPADRDDLLTALRAPSVRYPLTRARLERCGARIVETARRLAAAHAPKAAPIPADD
ncbi:MAG: glycoside hydrolase family 3 N-terminal domain-containing protein [Gemmiger sp.]